MTSDYPIPPGSMLYPVPADDGSFAGEYEAVTLGEAIDRGFEVVRACMLDATRHGVPAYAAVASLLWMITRRDDHAVLASRPLVDELEAAGVTIPADWVERLEALVREIYSAAAESNAEPMEPSGPVVERRLKRIERDSRAAWISEGRVPRTRVRIPAAMASRIAPVRPSAQPRARERRAAASRGNARAPTDDGPSDEPPPALGRLLRALARLFGGAR